MRGSSGFELRATAAAVDAQTVLRRRVAAAAQVTWSGAFRAAYDDELARLTARSVALGDALRRAAVAADAEAASRLTRAGRVS